MRGAWHSEGPDKQGMTEPPKRHALWDKIGPGKTSKNIIEVQRTAQTHGTGRRAATKTPADTLQAKQTDTEAPTTETQNSSQEPEGMPKGVRRKVKRQTEQVRREEKGTLEEARREQKPWQAKVQPQPAKAQATGELEQGDPQPPDKAP